MHGRTGDRPLIQADEFLQDDLTPAYDDPWAVLVQVLADALADVDQAERRSQQRSQLIPCGYIRDGAIYPDDGR